MKVGRKTVDHSQPDTHRSALLAQEVLPPTGFGILTGAKNPHARTVKIGTATCEDSEEKWGSYPQDLCCQWPLPQNNAKEDMNGQPTHCFCLPTNKLAHTNWSLLTCCH